MKLHLSSLVGTIVALSACASTNPKQLGPSPIDYREAIAEYLTASLFDPYSVRDAMISEPRIGNSLTGPKWNVCFRGNAKNRLGGYTGLSETLFVFDGETIISADREFAAVTCSGAVYSDFPELAG